MHIPNGFAGYRFWMANTPYPQNAHKLENPELFGSHDGVFWEVPAGVQNPLAPAPDGDDRHYNSDPCLLHHEDRLLLYFRTSDEESAPRRDWISVMASHDGRDWSEPRRVIEDATGRLLLCPAIRVVDGQFVMWTVENAGSPLLTICRRTSADGENWTAPKPASLLWPYAPLEPWHIDVVQQEAGLAMVFSGRMPGGRETQRFYRATGKGESWDVDGPLDIDICAFEAGKAYKPSLVILDENGSQGRLYTSSRGLDGRWYTALRPYRIRPS